MSLAASLQHHPLLHALVATQRRNVPWLVALRNTAAIVLPVAVGELTGHCDAGLAVSVGALVTMFADQPGPYRLRVQRTLATACVAGIAAFAGSVLGQWPDALYLAAALWGFAAAFLVAIGPYATRAGLISMVLLMVMGAEPAATAPSLQAAGLIFAGGVLQTLFAILAWPLQRYRPERQALAAAFRDLARVARRPVAPGAEPALPPSLNDLQTALYGSGHARGRATEAFWVLAELAERIRIELTLLSDLEALAATAPTRECVHALRGAAAGVLDALATALTDAAPPAAHGAMADYATAVAATRGTDTGPHAATATARAQALGGQLRAALRNADSAGSRGEIRAQRAEYRLPIALRPANPVAILGANLRWSSPAFRHGVRCGVCLVVALLLSHMLPLTRSYWVPMTIAIVLKPDFGATWRYGLLRVAGTLGGLFVTTAFLHLAGFNNFWAALTLMTVLCYAYRELAAVHYGVAVVCLTGLVVVLLSFYGIPAETSVHARALNTAIGSALALAAYFVWPTWERGRERAVLAHMLDTYASYLDAVLRGDAATCRETRIAARAARSDAQASLDRLRTEPASRANLPRAEALVAQANRLVRVAMVLEAARGGSASASPPAGSVDFAGVCARALAAAADAVREARVPRGAFALRAAQQRFNHALRGGAAEPTRPLQSALLNASDRIVDAIDSVLHVLAQLRPT